MKLSGKRTVSGQISGKFVFKRTPKEQSVNTDNLSGIKDRAVMRIIPHLLLCFFL